MSENYAAFISYSHRDAHWAKWLQRALEVYRLPAGLSSQTQLPRRLGKVFRDREELSTGQNLGEHLTRALDQSDNLIVICSPNACASPWVAKEIEYFKAQGKTNRIFCLLVEGGAEALPKPLLTDAEGKPLEPLAADPRTSGDGKTLAKLKLVSGMLGLNLDQLTQREQARARQRSLQIAASVAVFLGAIGWGMLSYQAYQREQRDSFEVVRSLTPLMTASIDYIEKETLSDAAQALNSWVKRIDNDSPIKGAIEIKAKGSFAIASAAYDLGKKEDSLKAYREAKALSAEALKRDPSNIDLAIDVAFADFYIGSIFFYEGDFNSARAPFEAYRQKIVRLYTEHPEHPLLISEAIDAPATTLANLSGLKSVFDEELALKVADVNSAIAKVLQTNTNQHEVLRAANASTNQVAEAYLKSCLVNDAVVYRKQAVAYAQRALDLDPLNREYKINLANALDALANSLNMLGDSRDATFRFLQAFNMQNDLLRTDPNNKYIADRLLRLKLKLLSVKTYHPEVLAKFPLAENILNETDFLIEAERLDRDLLYLMTYFELAKHALSHEDLDSALHFSDQMLQLARQHPDIALRADFAYAQIIQSMAARSSNEQTDPREPLKASANEGESCIKRRRYWAEAILRGDYNAARAIYEDAVSVGLVGLEMPFFAKLLGLSYEASTTQKTTK